MSTTLITGPAVEPLTLAEAKSYLRVEHDDDDALITALVTAARAHVEAATRRALIDQTWRLTLDAWPVQGRIAVTPAPLRSLAAARRYDQSGAAHLIDPQLFVVDAGASTIAFAPWAAPAPGRAAAGIEIDVEVGYGATAAAVPDPLRQAIRLLVAHWYENRAIMEIGHLVAQLPATVAGLIAPYRLVLL